MTASQDERFMAAALALGRRGQGRAAPNPAVGALVVRDHIVVGRGFTQEGGRPHAEAVALAEAGAAARGATIYVTLEPCSHVGRGGPCCEVIVAAGIARLVYAIDDPNPRVAGQGATYCRAHGVVVEAGVLAQVARRDHRGHMLRMTHGRPMVTLKLAETADGYVAGGPHDPRLAITGVAANGLVHGLRAAHDAIMVGIGTVLADDPLMTVRLPGAVARPARVVLDAEARTPPRSRLVQTAAEAPVVLLIASDAPQDRTAVLEAIEGVTVVPSRRGADGWLDLAAALAGLAERGLTRVFSEGGPTVAGSLLDAGLADEVLMLTAPKPFGREGVPALSDAAKATLAARYTLAEDRLVGVDRLRRWERDA